MPCIKSEGPKPPNLMIFNDMKDKLLSILDDISNYDIGDMFYSLTVNYKDIVKEFNHEKFDVNTVRNIILDINEIETFNLTINNYGKYDEKRYESYFFTTNLTFHSEGIVFTFSSPYLSNMFIDGIPDVKHLIKILGEHKKSSENLYNVIKNLDK